EGGVAPSETGAIALSRDGLVAANRNRAAGLGHSALRIILVSCGRNRLYDGCAIFRQQPFALCSSDLAFVRAGRNKLSLSCSTRLHELKRHMRARFAARDQARLRR